MTDNQRNRTVPRDDTRIALSVVIPAFDEAQRLPAFLADASGWLAAAYPGQYEIIVVDDGSRDDTAAVAVRYVGARVLRLPRNRGKGLAVRVGMLAACGAMRLFADADGATPISQVPRLVHALMQGADVAVGSRAAPGGRRRRWRGAAAPAADPPTELDAPPQWEVRLHRHLFGRVFAWLVWGTTGVQVADTQCGFKLFRAAAAERLFSDATCDGWAFDVEVLALARVFGLSVVEVPVAWHETPGSKVHVVRDGVRMLRDLVVIRRRLHTVARRPGPGAGEMVRVPPASPQA